MDIPKKSIDFLNKDTAPISGREKNTINCHRLVRSVMVHQKMMELLSEKRMQKEVVPGSD